eukprot:CAMPEP_0119134144 /NCGR_PEP_ID=MMETSP1310-20130426/15742_1 /TAXON_ID=464262 /ORGANISM="Genus nov. species nov., Strain RCC2339" /LENGTH=34 /DNA_ID= /DNA_START= /DNA_END= /DNA_ORIENTATION=
MSITLVPLEDEDAPSLPPYMVTTGPASISRTAAS